MRTLAPALVALASSAAIAVAIAAPVRAQDVAADSTQRLRRGQETLSPDALRLDLAARDQARGDVRGVIEDLEGLDLSAGMSFDQADRAAFLLGEPISSSATRTASRASPARSRPGSARACSRAGWHSSCA